MSTLSIILLISLIIVILISIFFIRNLLFKYEGLETLKDSYEMVFIDFIRRIQDSDRKLKAIDKKGAFEADDEVGFFFIELKKIQVILNEFIDNVYKVKPDKKESIKNP